MKKTGEIPLFLYETKTSCQAGDIMEGKNAAKIRDYIQKQLDKKSGNAAESPLLWQPVYGSQVAEVQGADHYVSDRAVKKPYKYI